MYKKLLIILGLCFIGNAGFCSGKYADSSYLVKGFQNLESVQQLSIINRLSAIADNDGVVFSKFWPEEYFSKKNELSYIYLVKNEKYITDIIKFDYPLIDNANCRTKDNPEFCIPKFQPRMESYIYNERLLAENTPDFISKPKQKEVLEVLLKDGKYFDTMKIKSIDEDNQPEIYRECDFEQGFLTGCRTYDKTTEDLLFSEEIVLKEPLQEGEANPLDKALRYVKYDSNGNKIEEYVFSNAKHSFYDDKGNLIALEQFNDSKIKYMNKKYPDLYIDVEFKKDDMGRVIEESHYDKNHKLMRKYCADYEGNKIANIHVEDLLNFASWDIKPINISLIRDQLFAIRF